MKFAIKLVVFTFLVSYSVACHAQVELKPSYSLSIGVGSNGYLSYGNSTIPSYNAGIRRTSPLNDKLFSRAHILMGNRGAEYMFTDGIFDYSYLQLQTGYQVGLLVSNNLSVQLGPYFAYNFKQNLDYSIGDNAISKYGVTGSQDYKTEDEFNDFEVGLNVEAELRLSNRFSVSLNLNQALTRAYNSGNPYKILQIVDHNYSSLLLSDSEKKMMDKRLNNAFSTAVVLSLNVNIFQ